MGFDTKKFLDEKFEARTAEVPVPDMAAWFKGRQKAPKENGGVAQQHVWKVRGLTGKEIGFAREAMVRNQAITKLQAALPGADITDTVKGMLNVLKLDRATTPDDVVLALEYFRLGSLEPKCTLELALKVCKVFPIEFDTIQRKIQKLTGLGMMPGKPKKSGKKQT